MCHRDDRALPGRELVGRSLLKQSLSPLGTEFAEPLNVFMAHLKLPSLGFMHLHPH